MSTRAAFLSTPSLYFSLKNKELKENSYVFDVRFWRERADSQSETRTLARPGCEREIWSAVDNRRRPLASPPAQLDEQWAKHKTYVRYDFNAPLDVPEALHHTFDCVVRLAAVLLISHRHLALHYVHLEALAVADPKFTDFWQVIDPPFITREVWEKYAEVRSERFTHSASPLWVPSCVRLRPVTRRHCDPEALRPALPVRCCASPRADGEASA